MGTEKDPLIEEWTLQQKSWRILGSCEDMWLGAAIGLRKALKKQYLSKGFNT
jgi:hypothetical protein